VIKKLQAKKQKNRKKLSTARARFPRHSASKSLRIAKAILEQNAGKPSTSKEAASFLGVWPGGPFEVEIASGVKFGFLERPETGKVQPTELAKQILRPKLQSDEIDG
jgi:hypothetical protein